MDLKNFKSKKPTLICKTHGQPIQALCAYPSCLTTLLCINCLKSHPPIHSEYMIPCSDLFSCAILKNLSREIEASKMKENNKISEIEQNYAQINIAFRKLEEDLITNLRRVEDAIKEKTSENLKKHRAETEYLIGLKSKIEAKFQNAVHKKFADEAVLNDYISLYEKTFNKIERTTLQDLSKKPEAKDKAMVVNYSVIDQGLIDINKIIEGFPVNVFMKSLVLTSLENSPIIKPFKKDQLKRVQQVSLDLTSLMRSNRLRTERAIVTRRPLIELSYRDGSSVNKSMSLPKYREYSVLIDPMKSNAANLAKLVKTTRKAWNLVDPQILESEHDGIISSVLFIKELGVLVTAGKEGRIQIWDAINFDLKRTIDSENSRITCLRYVHNRRFLFVGCKDSTIKIYNLSSISSQPIILVGHHGPISALEYLAITDQIASSSSLDGRPIKLWNLTSMSIDFEFVTGETEVRALAFVEHEGILAAGLGEGAINLYSVFEIRLLCTLDTSFGFRNKNKDVINLCLNQQQSTLFCGNIDGAFSVWDISVIPPNPIRNFRNALRNACFEFITEKRVAVIMSKDKKLRIQDVMTGKNLNIVSDVEEEVSSITFLRDQNHLLLTDPKSGNVKIWTIQHS